MSTILAAFAAVGLMARLADVAPPPAASPAAGPVDVRISGDVTYEPGSGRILVENGAVLRRGAVVIRARSATFDPATGEVRAAGGVLLTDATRAIAADAIRAVFGGEWEAEGVVAFVKDVPADLASASTVEDARGAGRNRLSFSGSRLRGDTEGRLRLDGARLTLCDCPGGCAPSWEVTARSADIAPGRRAILSWAVLRITPRFLFIDRPVPVLVLPWLYVPLGDRQSGLLLPEIGGGRETGFAVAESIFVTLGRSADATLTSEYASGGRSLRGPGARLELRWAPAAGAGGLVEVAWLHDLEREAGGEGGDRFAITGGHGQRLSDRTSLQAGLRLAGDPVWVRDHTTDAIARTVPYRRSDLLASRRSDAVVLEAGASYLQPLRPNGVVAGEDYGLFGADLGAASRWPAASASLLPQGVGPLRLSGRAGVTRHAPASGAFEREVVPGVPRRPGATRADARAEIALPLVLGGALSLAPYVRGAAAGYAFEATQDPLASAWGVGGVVLGTELSRRFGEVRHAVSPRLEWRAGTALQGDPLPWLAYDAFDRSGAGLLSSAPPGAWSQLRAAVETRLARAGSELLRVEIGQDYDLRRGRFAEGFATARASVGRVAADASARLFTIDDREDGSAPRPPIPSRILDRFTSLGANVSVGDRRGDSVHAGFSAVGPGGSGMLVAGIDPLFDVRAAQLGAAAYASGGARFALGPATFGYDASFLGRAGFRPACTAGGAPRRLEGWQPYQHVATFAWDSPCRCFRLAAHVTVDDCGEVTSYKATIDLSQVRLSGLRP